MIKFALILAVAVSCVAQEATNSTIVITLSPDDIWSVQRQLLRPLISKTNFPPMPTPTTVSNYVANMFRRQIDGFTKMELQQFEWEERAKLGSAHPVIRARVHELLGVSNAPPSIIPRVP